VFDCLGAGDRSQAHSASRNGRFRLSVALRSDFFTSSPKGVGSNFPCQHPFLLRVRHLPWSRRATMSDRSDDNEESRFPMISLRPSTLGDAPGLCACVDAIARERRYLKVVSGFTVEETRAFLTSLAESGGVQMLAVAGDTVVGWCDVVPLPFEGMRHVGRLGMGLVPAWRGQGLGRRLLREVLGRAFSAGLLRVELEVFASNVAAIRLYEREGFVTEGRKRRARIVEGIDDDVILMGLLREHWPG
jgi:RimJ/RimL family protein N-acetyltransferase